MTHEKLNALAELIALRQKQGYDSPIAITGFEGYGKSNLSLQLAMRVAKINNLPFDLEKNIAYKRKEMMPKIAAIEPGQQLIADEAINIAYNLDFASRESKDLKKLFAQIRFKHLVFFFNIPKLWMLDTFFKQHRIRLWVHVVDRGTAVVFRPNENAFIEDAWHRKEALKKIGNQYVSFTDTASRKAGIYRKVPSYLDTFIIPKVPKRTWERYQEISERRKLEIDDPEKDDYVEDPTGLDLSRKKQVDGLIGAARLMEKKGMTRKEISLALGYSEPQISLWFKLEKK